LLELLKISDFEELCKLEINLKPISVVYFWKAESKCYLKEEISLKSKSSRKILSQLRETDELKTKVFEYNQQSTMDRPKLYFSKMVRSNNYFK
jgi:hypothetical protein